MNDWKSISIYLSICLSYLDQCRKQGDALVLLAKEHKTAKKLVCFIAAFDSVSLLLFGVCCKAQGLPAERSAAFRSALHRKDDTSEHM